MRVTNYTELLAIYISYISTLNTYLWKKRLPSLLEVPSFGIIGHDLESALC